MIKKIDKMIVYIIVQVQCLIIKNGQYTDIHSIGNIGNTNNN